MDVNLKLSKDVSSKFGIPEFGNDTLLAFDSIRCFELSVKYKLDITYVDNTNTVVVSTHTNPSVYTVEKFKEHYDDPIMATRIAIMKTLLKMEVQ
jgi:hypothetical protein